MINLHEPIFDETDEKYVLESIQSSWVSTGGPFVDQFEKEFADFVGAKHAVSVCNGTLGLQLSLECLKRKRNVYDNYEVLVPSLTFIATTNAIGHAGGFPVFVDVQENFFQMSFDSLKQIITNNYSFSKNEKIWKNKVTNQMLLAVMPVHIMGWAVSMNEILDFSSSYQIPIIEDAAEALGTYYLDGNHVGKSGLCSVFSFNGNKILTTGGGGMIVTNDDDFALHLKHLSTTAKIDGLRFVHDEIGYNYRLVNILAALGCSQLKKMNTKLKRKKEIFEQYFEYLHNDFVKIYIQNDCVSNNWLVNAIFSNVRLRESALSSLIENKIQARPLWTPCHLQPVYRQGTNYMKLKNTENMWERTLSLPSSPQLTNSQIKNISDTILSSLEGRQNVFKK